MCCTLTGTATHPGGKLDPATSTFKTHAIAVLKDNVGAFVLSGDFKDFKIPYYVVTWTFEPKTCKVTVETAFGPVTPIE